MPAANIYGGIIPGGDEVRGLDVSSALVSWRAVPAEEDGRGAEPSARRRAAQQAHPLGPEES